MKILITILLVIFSQASFAKDTLVDDCSHLKDASEAQFTLFNKKEFIQLGECLAVHSIKRSYINDLPMLCNEVTEDELGPFGFMSLTKLEAIYIGQCVGIINYIHQRYHDEKVANNRTRYRAHRRYTCLKGIDAVNTLRNSTNDKYYRDDVRDLLCVVR